MVTSFVVGPANNLAEEKHYTNERRHTPMPFFLPEDNV